MNLYEEKSLAQEQIPEFIEHHFKEIKNPVLLPPTYKITKITDKKIYYEKPDGTSVESDIYMHHSEPVIIVDEFRKKFPHDSVIVLLFGPYKELYLQKRGKHCRWEPSKVDLASIAGQRRGVLVGNTFEPVSLEENAVNTIQKETGIPHGELTKQKLRPIGTHFNSTTNEYQTIYAYQVTTDIAMMNELLKTTMDQGEFWIAQGYQVTLDEYFGDGVAKYAGGEDLRPLNFISSPDIKATLDSYAIQE